MDFVENGYKTKHGAGGDGNNDDDDDDDDNEPELPEPNIIHAYVKESDMFSIGPRGGELRNCTAVPRKALDADFVALYEQEQARDEAIREVRARELREANNSTRVFAAGGSRKRKANSLFGDR